MNFNMDLWEKTEAKEFGDYETLKLGGHDTIIVDAREHTNETTGNISLKISVDIAGNDEQKEFFRKQYEANTNKDKKWSSSAVKYLSLKDEQLAYLKGFITALENSNKNFKFNTKGDWSQLKNLHIASVFGLEEFEKQDNTIGTATKLVQFRSLDKLKDIKIPKVKLLDGTFVEYEEYNSRKQENKSNDPFKDFGDVVEIDDNFLD